MSLRGFVLIAALCVSCVALFAAEDPLMGTWKLNVEKSKFEPGPAPKSAIRKHEPAGSGIKVTTDTVTADGKQTHLEFTAAFDEKFYPITGVGARDGVSLKRISPNVVEGKNGTEDKPTTKIVWTISKDGKTLTYTIDSIAPEGRAVHNISIYEKQ